ncbi:unnamed protein product, partial [Iphiclides podalirius]
MNKVYLRREGRTATDWRAGRTDGVREAGWGPAKHCQPLHVALELESLDALCSPIRAITAMFTVEFSEPPAFLRHTGTEI